MKLFFLTLSSGNTNCSKIPEALLFFSFVYTHFADISQTSGSFLSCVCVSILIKIIRTPLHNHLPGKISPLVYYAPWLWASFTFSDSWFLSFISSRQWALLVFPNLCYKLPKNRKVVFFIVFAVIWKSFQVLSWYNHQAYLTGFHSPCKHSAVLFFYLWKIMFHTLGPIFSFLSLTGKSSLC